VGERHGHIFDHFAVEFEYPGGVPMFSQCRQIDSCDNKVEELVVGTQGKSNCKDSIQLKDGKRWRFREKETSAYQQEHMNLIASIQAGKPINEARAIAESTMTGILGREAVYSGRELDWTTALSSKRTLGPERYTLDPYPIPEIAMPGRYRFS
jgi:hypothetical protein